MSKQHFLHLNCCQTSGLLSPKFSLERKKFFTQDRHCCCSSLAVALLSCPAPISFLSGTALSLLTRQGFSQSLSFACSYVPASHCPRRCLVATGVSAPMSFSKTPIKHHCQGLISHHLSAIHRAALWVVGLQISLVPLFLPMLCCCCARRPCVWAEPAPEGSVSLTLQSWGSSPRL